MPSPTQIADLKTQWLKDPVWDIEDTAGFEEHREELRAFAEATRREREEKKQERFKAAAILIGLEENPELAAYVFDLNRRVAMLEMVIERMCKKVEHMENGTRP